MASTFDPRETCLHLRSKEMFYRDATPEDLAYEKDAEEVLGRADTAMYWCECTQTGRGPDERPVHRESCSRATRRCFVSVESLV